jgi:hypothetical protein
MISMFEIFYQPNEHVILLLIIEKKGNVYIWTLTTLPTKYLIRDLLSSFYMMQSILMTVFDRSRFLLRNNLN